MSTDKGSILKGIARGVGKLHLREKPDFAIALKPFILKELFWLGKAHI